jgi:HD-like signal output (HDOD) protein/CheY-like chemotaxis protein
MVLGGASEAVMTEMKRVLFVDEDRNALEALKRALEPRTEWQMAFSSSGPEALTKLTESEFDVIVTHTGTPSLGGSELLNEVIRSYPNIVRIALCDTLADDLVLRSASMAHQSLVKPLDAATLQTTVSRALQVREMLASPRLRTLVSRMTSLPSLPSVHMKLVQSLSNPDLSSRDLGEIIAQDVGMTAKTLQIANSAFFGLYRYVASPAEAAVYLGVDIIRALTLSTGVFSAFQETGLPHFFIGKLQRHSTITGLMACDIAKQEGLPKRVCDTSLVGGLLHDVGHLVLASSCPAEYNEVLAAAGKDGMSCHELEQKTFGATHAEIGAYLLWLWGLPDAVCNAVAFHHKPAECSATVLTAAGAIHVADAFEHELANSSDSAGRPVVDMKYLNTLGLADRLPEWRRLCKRHGDRGEQ